jgi:hypothetical protein
VLSLERRRGDDRGECWQTTESGLPKPWDGLYGPKEDNRPLFPRRADPTVQAVPRAGQRERAGRTRAPAGRMASERPYAQEARADL